MSINGSRIVTKECRMEKELSEVHNQTRLLILNAMMEAARSGEAGENFAIKVKEIIELAEKDEEGTSI